MPAFDPQQLAADCGGEWSETPAATVTGFSIDTRTLRPGELFVALNTERRDGHEFLSAAAALDASGALVSRGGGVPGLARLHVPDTLKAFQQLAAAHRRRFPFPVIGVTGSAGKTSTKDLLAAILGEPGEAAATTGNLNNHLGVPLTLLRLDPARHRFAVIEAGVSAPGEMDVIASLIAPDVALITTIAEAHLDGLGSIEGVSEEKARLAHHLRADGVAVFPSACLRFRAFREMVKPAHVAVMAGAGVEDFPNGMHQVPVAVRHEREATGIRVTWKGVLEEFDIRPVTPGMAANAALAVIAAFHLGVSAADIRARFARWKPASLRGELLSLDDRMVYLDCYNANPASMADALQAFVSLSPGTAPRLYVVGCMEELGARAAAMHRAVGESWPLRGGDQLIVFGTHADELADGARTVGADAGILVNPERAEAERLIRESRGAVFVKGSRRYQLETLVHSTGGGVPHETETAA